MRRSSKPCFPASCNASGACSCLFPAHVAPAAPPKTSCHHKPSCRQLRQQQRLCKTLTLPGGSRQRPHCHCRPSCFRLNQTMHAALQAIASAAAALQDDDPAVRQQAASALSLQAGRSAFNRFRIAVHPGVIDDLVSKPSLHAFSHAICLTQRVQPFSHRCAPRGGCCTGEHIVAERMQLPI